MNLGDLCVFLLDNWRDGMLRKIHSDHSLDSWFRAGILDGLSSADI